MKRILKLHCSSSLLQRRFCGVSFLEKWSCEADDGANRIPEMYYSRLPLHIRTMPADVLRLAIDSSPKLNTLSSDLLFTRESLPYPKNSH